MPRRSIGSGARGNAVRMSRSGGSLLSLKKKWGALLSTSTYGSGSKLIHVKMTHLPPPLQAKEETLLEGALKASLLQSVFGLVGHTLPQFPD